jgi:hypothetical protein
MWALLIAVTPPLLDLRLSIGQIEEDFHVQAFVTRSTVEALDVAVSSRSFTLDHGADRQSPL